MWSTQPVFPATAFKISVQARNMDYQFSVIKTINQKIGVRNK
jgi:hypothetical protein